MLEAIIGGAILLLEGSLSERTELIMSSDLCVKGVKHGFEVCDEFVKSFFCIGDGVVGHSIIPSFCIGGSSSSAHLVQSSHDLGGVRGIEGGVQGEVGLHGLDPTSGIIVLPREVCRKSSLQLCVV